SPIGSYCLPACGVAWHDQQTSRDSVTICSIGDGATRQGEFFEALAFAIEYKLPIIFVVIDNELAISTRTVGRKATDLGLVPDRLLRNLDSIQCSELVRT